MKIFLSSVALSSYVLAGSFFDVIRGDQSAPDDERVDASAQHFKHGRFDTKDVATRKEEHVAAEDFPFRRPLSDHNPKDVTQGVRRRLKAGTNIAAALKEELDSGASYPRFTLEARYDDGNLFSDAEPFELNVVMTVPSVTDDTSYSVYGGPEKMVGSSSQHFLIADPDHESKASNAHHKSELVLLAVNLDKATVRGFVQKGSMVVSLTQDDGKDILVTDMSELPSRDWTCSTEDDNEHKSHSHRETKSTLDLEDLSTHLGFDVNTQNRRRVSRNNVDIGDWSFHVDLYIEVDTRLARQQDGMGFDEDIPRTIEYINALVTAVSALYEQEIDTHLRVMHISLTDRYDDESETAVALNLMMQAFASYDAWHYTDHYGRTPDLHQGLFGRNMGGGRASVDTDPQTFDFATSVCNPALGFAVSSGIRGSLSDIELGELYWDFMVFAHEVGHNFGSRHTHDPVGYWPVIDGCGNDCNGLGPPGSIMSYCHQCASISLGGVLTTFGGTCDSGDCSDINNWQNSPYNVGNNPKRVPHKMYGQMSGLGACVQPYVPGPPQPECNFTTAETDCDDSNTCTADICIAVDEEILRQCKHRLISECCGNGVCEPGEESECAEDCGPFTVYTLPIIQPDPVYITSLGNHGSYFEIQAKNGIIISSMHLPFKNKVGGNNPWTTRVRVYTAPSAFEGAFENIVDDESSWTLVHDQEYYMRDFYWCLCPTWQCRPCIDYPSVGCDDNPDPEPYSCGYERWMTLEFTQPVEVPSGSMQAFYVHSTVNTVRNNIRNTDHTMSDNNVILLNNRAVTKYRLSYGDSDPFSTSSCCTVRDDRSLMWIGNLNYVSLENTMYPTTSPTLTPTASPTATFMPSDTPSLSIMPSLSWLPSTSPSEHPSDAPSMSPSTEPSSSPSVLPLEASYNGKLGVPVCELNEASGCSTGSLVVGRGNAGLISEKNAPNTLDGCQDGNNEREQQNPNFSESLDQVIIRSTEEDGLLRAGGGATISALVRNGLYVDFFFSADISNLGTYNPTASPTGSSMPTSASARSQMAVFLPTFGAPGCLSYSSSCDTGVSLVAGRYTHGPDFLPEQNNPNTIDGCQDGDYDRNTYYIEWITLRSGGVTQNDSSEPLRSGDRATIVVTSLLEGGQSDWVEFFYATDAFNPQWQWISSLHPPNVGLAELKVSFIIPEGATFQAIRVQGSNVRSLDPCSPNEKSDRDDLVFMAMPAAIHTDDDMPTANDDMPIVASIMTSNLAESRLSASYDSVFGAPSCSSYSSSCDTGSSLIARRGSGLNWEPELNHPNTIDGCQDGSSEIDSYYVHRIVVRSGGYNSPQNAPLRSGDRATIIATVLPYQYQRDFVEFFYATDASNPQWQSIDGVGSARHPYSPGYSEVWWEYTIPEGATYQAVRIQIGIFQSWGNACLDNTYNERDDLVFMVMPAPAITSKPSMSPSLSSLPTTSLMPTRSSFATFDSSFGAPSCLSSNLSSCDTGPSLIVNRGTRGEPNYPNTIDGCPDGRTSRDSHYVNRIFLKAGPIDGTDSSAVLQSGEIATIIATVDINNWNEDYIEFFHASDASNPQWELIESLWARTATSTPSGVSEVAVSYTIPAGATYQAVRVMTGYQRYSNACPSGSGTYFSDRDDLVFQAAQAPISWTYIGTVSTGWTFYDGIVQLDYTLPEGFNQFQAVRVQFRKTELGGHPVETCQEGSRNERDDLVFAVIGSPTIPPTDSPSTNPSNFPSFEPTKDPSKWPSLSPSVSPSDSPTDSASDGPSSTPSAAPSASSVPTASIQPTSVTSSPIAGQGAQPSDLPSLSPSTLSPTNLPVGPLDASFDSQFGAPRCSGAASSCDSGTSMLAGRGTYTPEQNQPNTIDSCSDGVRFYNSFYVDRIIVRSGYANEDDSSSPLMTGGAATIVATVKAYTTTTDWVDFFFTSDAANPQWQLIESVRPSRSGNQELMMSYTIPMGSTIQAVRVQMGYYSDNSPCSNSYGYVDRDDLVFEAITTPTISPSPTSSYRAVYASYDASLGAPLCEVAALSCDSGTSMLAGRGTYTPEQNQPNTIDTCSDGVRFFNSFYVDRIIVRSGYANEDDSSSPLVPGGAATIVATVKAYSTTRDWVDFFFTSDAANPQWQLIESVRPSTSGNQELMMSYTIPMGSTTQAVRVQIGYYSNNSPCSNTNGYVDRDDLVFTLAEAMTTTTTTTTAVTTTTTTATTTTTTATAVTTTTTNTKPTVTPSTSSPINELTIPPTLCEADLHVLCINELDTLCSCAGLVCSFNSNKTITGFWCSNSNEDDPGTIGPTMSPTASPSASPSNMPSMTPTASPSASPSSSPSVNPSNSPTSSPTNKPTNVTTSPSKTIGPTTTSPSKGPTPLPTRASKSSKESKSTKVTPAPITPKPTQAKAQKTSKR